MIEHNGYIYTRDGVLLSKVHGNNIIIHNLELGWLTYNENNRIINTAFNLEDSLCLLNITTINL